MAAAAPAVAATRPIAPPRPRVLGRVRGTVPQEQTGPEKRGGVGGTRSRKDTIVSSATRQHNGTRSFQGGSARPQISRRKRDDKHLGDIQEGEPSQQEKLDRWHLFCEAAEAATAAGNEGKEGPTKE